MLSVIVGAVGHWNHPLGATLWESETVVLLHWEFHGAGTSDGVAVWLLEGVLSKNKQTNTTYLTSCRPGSTLFYPCVKTTFINLGDILGHKKILQMPTAQGRTGTTLFQRPRVMPRMDSQETPRPWSQDVVIKREQ